MQAHSLDLASSKDQGDEQIRRNYFRRESAIRSVGLLYYLGGAMFTLSGLYLAISSMYDDMTFLLVMIVLMALFAAFSFYMGYGIRNLSKGAKRSLLISTILGLFAFPVGTLVNLYILYLLVSKEGKYVMSTDYADVIRRTPSIEYKPSIVFWIAIGLLFALFAVGFVSFASSFEKDASEKYRIGLRYMEGKHITQDKKKGWEYIWESCNEGHPEGCLYVANIYHDSKDFVNSMKFHLDACNGGIPIACTMVGLMFDRGQGTSQDENKAIQHYQRSCSDGEPNACFVLGYKYQEGKGVAKDTDRAKSLYKKACEKGYQKACAVIAEK